MEILTEFDKDRAELTKEVLPENGQEVFFKEIKYGYSHKGVYYLSGNQRDWFETKYMSFPSFLVESWHPVKVEL